MLNAPSHPVRLWHLLAAALLCVAAPAAPAHALTPDELVLVVNKNEPRGLELAEFYAKARHVPAARICVLDLPPGDSIPFDRYERDVVPAVRKFLRDSRLERQAKCLVTFYGVPLRIEGKRTPDEEKVELIELRQSLDQARLEILGVVKAVEDRAQELHPAFEPAAKGEELTDLSRRADAAMRLVAERALAPKRDAAPTSGPVAEAPARLFRALQLLAGPAAVAQQFTDDQIRRLGLTDAEVQPWPARRREVEEAARKMAQLAEQRFDANARRELRELAKTHTGLFGFVRALNGQIEYLDNDGTAAAFDSELALLWWDGYSRSKWQANLLHHRPRAQGSLRAGGPPTLMVARLDAPTAELVRDGIILASLRGELGGLKGKAVVDSRGLRKKPANPNTLRGRADANDSYAAYDETVRALANALKHRTGLEVVTDDRDPVIAAEPKVEKVALYCGWYSVRNYVPAFEFVPGAVGYHIASFELTTLRHPADKGWVKGMLTDGVAATLGPVAEPYLQAFPLPNEFFPLLLTGRMTLAEVYWSTCPMTSWMMCLIGDPLYTPYKTNPEFTPEELPPNLRQLVSEFPAPTTAPATQP